VKNKIPGADNAHAIEVSLI